MNKNKINIPIEYRIAFLFLFGFSLISTPLFFMTMTALMILNLNPIHAITIYYILGMLALGSALILIFKLNKGDKHD